jgi:hypothetical protein
MIFSYNVYSQVEDESVNKQGWVDYNISYGGVKNSINYYGDTGYRIISPDLWTRYYIRPAVSYTRSPLTEPGKKTTEVYHLGIGVFFTNNTDYPNSMEIRPFQGYNIQWPVFSRLRISHYVRIEERFEYHYGDNSWDFGFRARYQLSGVLTWGTTFLKSMEGLYFPFHVEFFINFNPTTQFNDLIRVTPGLGYTFSPEWKAEFSVSYHRLRNTLTDVFETNDIVFRFRVFQTIF